jgi:prepilin-type processing-associated H-X9-DG protein
MYCGVDLDLNRWTLDPPLRDSEAVHERLFGSAHAHGCSFVFCDGHLEHVSYAVDSFVHRSRGNRRDAANGQ